MTVPDGNNITPDPRRGTLGQFIERATPIQLASILVFVILSAAIGVVGIFMINGAVQSDTGYKVLAVFVPITLASALFAWLDNETLKLFAAGVGALLDVHRAALAAFIAAGLAAIAVSLFVALSSLFADGPEDGVFALAAIEFLLKLAAVSAIIVLITLRRDKDAGGGDQAADQGNGKLEFGTIAFAFSLVIIAALIVPRDDLLRFGSMFFGGEKRLEDYLPTRPVAKVEQGLKKEIRTAVVSSIARLDALKPLSMPELERQIDGLALEQTIFAVLAVNVLRQTERRGALPLLKSICQNTEDTLIFSHSDNRALAEHLDFLSSEGLIEYPYGDPRSISITRYGSEVLKEHSGQYCPSKGLASETSGAAETDTRLPSTDATTTPSGEPVRKAPFELRVNLGTRPRSFLLELSRGEYIAELVPEGDADPVLELSDPAGGFIDSDDDGGPGFGAVLPITVTGPPLLLNALAFSGYGGWAILRITQSVAEYCDLNTEPSTKLSGATTQQFGVVLIPPNCAAFQYKPTVSSDYQFTFDPEGFDELTASLLVVDQANPSQASHVATTDSTPLQATLEAGRTYYLLVGYREHSGQPISANVEVTPVEALSPTDPAPAGDASAGR